MLVNKKVYPLASIDSLYGFLSYGIDTILVLYLIQVVGNSNYSALNSLSVKSCLIYSLPILSSFLSNKLISSEGLASVGLLFMTTGLVFLNNDSDKIILSLSLLTVGYSIGKPTFSIILGKITSQHSNLKFIRIFYLISNLCLLLAPILFSLTLYNKNKIVLTSLIIISFVVNFIYIFFFSKEIFQQNILNFIKAMIIIGGLTFVINKLLYSPEYLKYLFFIAVLTMAVYLIKILYNRNPDDRKNVYNFIILIIISIVFFIFFSQQFFFMPLFLEKYVNLTINNIRVSTPWFNMLNPFFGIIIAPIFNIFFKNIKFKTVIILTLFFLGLSILIFVIGIIYIKLIVICIFLTYFLLSISEVLLIPYILSTISIWKKDNEKSVFMGCLYLSAAFSKICAPILASSNISTSYLKNINNNENLINILFFTSSIFIAVSFLILVTKTIYKNK